MDLKMSVYSPALELIGELEIHKSIIWTEKAFSAGSFSLESLITAESTFLLQPENIIWIEGDTAGIIEYVQETAGTNGPYITVKGCTLTGILSRRILWGLYSMSGTPPAIMHELVNDCCINPTRGDIEARIIPGLALLDAPDGGESVRIQKTGGTLLEALEILGETYGVAFGVRFNPAIPRMEFWTRWGRDLTVHQNTNPQVFYSTELDDVLTSEYSYNAQDYRNVALVAGEGEGNDRTMVTVENEVAENQDTPVTPPEPDTPVKYTVTLLVDPAGGGIASGGKTVAAGVSITVTAAPSDGYEFAGWKDGDTIVSTKSAYTFRVNGNKTLTAVFAAVIPVYIVSATIDPAGSGTVSGTGSYQEGSTVTITATPEEGYKFTGWQENGTVVSTEETYTFTVSGNASFIAIFSVKPVSRLPEGYTEVEWIQNDNKSSYIRTGMYISGGEFTFDFSLPNGAPFSACYVFDSTNDKLQTYRENLNWYGKSASKYTTLYTELSDEKVRITGNGKTISVEGIVTTLASNTYASDITIPPSSASSSQIVRIYYFKGDPTSTFSTYNFELVPCVNPSGVAGLYDLKNNKFIAPTGSFTAGPSV